MKKKYVLITGSSRGIGRACAVAFAKNGYHVFINCKNSVEQLAETEHEILASGGGCTALPGDVSDPDVVRSIFCKIKKVCQGVDVLVNNAGITKDGLMLRMSEAQWDAVLNVNLKSAFNFIHACAPIMLRQRGGSIINMSSVVGVHGNAGQCNYSASKAGMIGLAKSIAQELGPKGVRANCVAPGFIETPMTAQLSEEIRKGWMAKIPLRRGGQTEDIANVCLFLASDLSSYVSGQVIQVDGGMNM